MKKRMPARRRYRQVARASSAEATGERILDAVLRRIQTQWFEEVTLDAVAKDADVTVQTVIRRFGGKDQLLEAASEHLGKGVMGRRAVASGDIVRGVHALTADYETVGDVVWRLLAQEERYPVLRPICDTGRRGHREWLSQLFEPWLDGLHSSAANRRLDGIVAATDVYLWKLLRRDFGRSINAYKACVFALLAGVLPADAAAALPSVAASARSGKRTRRTQLDAMADGDEHTGEEQS